MDKDVVKMLWVVLRLQKHCLASFRDEALKAEQAAHSHGEQVGSLSDLCTLLLIRVLLAARPLPEHLSCLKELPALPALEMQCKGSLCPKIELTSTTIMPFVRKIVALDTSIHRTPPYCISDGVSAAQ